MKFKYFALLSLGVLAVTSCSDDDNDFNTNNDVTVDFTDTELRVSEDQVSSTSFSYIPFVVNGESNGPIEVTIEVLPCGENPAEVDKNMVFTSYTYTIPAGEAAGSFQFYPKSNSEENPDRTFEVKIVDVKGAKVGAQTNCVVTLVDNESLIPTYYEGLAGVWEGVLESTNYGPTPAQFEIVTVAKGEEGYGEDLLLVDFPEAGMNAVASFSIDGVTQEIFVSLPSGQELGQITHPTYGIGKFMLYPLAGNSYTTSAYDFVLKFNFDLVSGSYVVDPEWNCGILVKFAAGMMLWDEYSGMEFYR